MAALQGERPRIDAEDLATRVDHVDRAAGDRETKAPQGRPREAGELDAMRGPAGCIERVHERRLAAAVVERVGPTPVGARRAAERLPAHLLLRVSRIDDRLRIELPSSDVVAADGVTRGIDLGEVLDQVDARTVRRDCVEAEVAVQPDRRAEAQRRRVQDEQPRRRAREAAARFDEDERVQVAGEPACRRVVGDRRDRVRAREERRREHLAAVAPDALDERAAGRRDRDVARDRLRHRDAGAADVDAEDGQPVGRCRRGEYRGE